mgnify:FL=1
MTSQQAELKVATLNYQATIATAQDKKQSLLDEKAAAEKAAQEAAKKQAAYEAQQKEAAKAQAASTAATTKAVEEATSTVSSSQASQSSSSSSNTSSNNTSSNSSSSSSNSSSSNSSNGGGSTNTGNNNAAGTGNTGGSSSSGINSTPIANPYAGGGCTDYVWQYFAAQGIYIRNIMPGNGGQWATNGPAQGVLHVVGAAPGVIASSFSADFVGYANSPYGHVAIVKSVNSNGTITIKEGGYGTTWWGHERTVSASGVTFLMPN